MEATYEFSAHNNESIYGYGTEEEASAYRDWLNKEREINLYEISVFGLTAERADTLTFNLRDDLAHLAIDP